MANARGERWGWPRRPVRVLFVNDTARNGGPGRSLDALLRFLDPSVVHRAVVLPRGGVVADLLSGGAADELLFLPGLVENPVEPWTRAIERRDFEAPGPVRAARFAGNVLRAAAAMRRLSAIVRRGRFDLVYGNGTSANFATAALGAATGVPAIWHVRYTSVPAAAAALHRALSGSRSVRRVVCVSRAAAPMFRHCAAKVAVVHNALDTTSFDPERVRGRLRAALGLGGDVVVFGAHGRVLRRKGYVELLRAARVASDRLRDAGSRVRLAVVVVGDTPQDFRPDHAAECRALAASLGIEGSVHMLGFQADVRPLIADFDVGVVPSVYPDPLPRAVLECMAMRKPVVAFDVGGVGEMIQSGVTGELVPFERGGPVGASDAAVDRLASSLVRYARDPALRAQQGRAARACVERDFDARDHARRIQGEILGACGLDAQEPR